ncbi:MAG: queuosine precursor transporter [Sphaerochaetaceae bacterium]|jgi:uncharacterized integral membrane protein (TIGR00697 family)
MNEFLSLLMLLFNFFAIMVVFRKWGRLGLYIWMPICIIIANIQVTKTVELFWLEATLGNVVFTGGALVTDLLNECYGAKHARRAVGIGFAALIALTVFMQIALWFEPAPSDFSNEALQTIFGFMPRIALSSLVAYLISNLSDIWIFSAVKKRFPGTRTLWLRKNLSTFISQFIDSFIFTFGAFYGVYEPSVLWQILLTTCLFKWVVATLDVPFIYLGRRWMDKGVIAKADQEAGSAATA